MSLGSHTSKKRPTTGDFQPVNPEDLKKYPYRSIGKLFWLCSENSVEVIKYATAFYCDDNTVMTVAHVFDERPKPPKSNSPKPKSSDPSAPDPSAPDLSAPDPSSPEKAIFVPAMISKYDIYGENYGYYKIDFDSGKRSPIPRIHADYKPRLDDKLTTPQFDVCTFKIVPKGRTLSRKHVKPWSTEIFFENSKNTELEFEDAHIDKGWTPIRPGLFPLDGDKATWTVLGYGQKKFWPKESDGSDGGKMSIVRGCGSSIHPKLEYNSDKELTVTSGELTIKPALRSGMSGGPWFYGADITPNSEAKGLQCGVYNGLSYSPLFTISLLIIVGVNELLKSLPAANPSK